MIPLAMPNLNGNEKKYLDDCIDTTYVSSVGEYVTRFEKDVADATGSKYAVATSSGTTGLHAALMTVGVHLDDLVIIPTFTFIATANAIAHCGAVPWLMDIDSASWCMDVKITEAELQEYCEIKDGKVIHVPSGRHVAAVMPVYTLGNMPDMLALRSMADEWKLPLIADAACAIGANYKGSGLGSLADLSVLSFNGNKTITCGGGGAVVGNDKKLLDHVRHLTTTARVWPNYDFDEVGFNYRMTNIQAAVGVAQMERLNEFIERKRAVRKFYSSALSDMKGISFFPDEVVGQKISCWFSGIVLDHGGEERVHGICDALKGVGIEARPFWKPVHMQKPYAEAPKSRLSVAEGLWDRIITLPCSTNITDEELEIVSRSIHELFSKPAFLL